MKILLSLVIVLLLTACSLEKMKAVNDIVCSELTEDMRKELIEKIRKKHPEWPEDGLCGIEERIMDKIANDTTI